MFLELIAMDAASDAANKVSEMQDRMEANFFPIFIKFPKYELKRLILADNYLQKTKEDIVIPISRIKRIEKERYGGAEYLQIILYGDSEILLDWTLEQAHQYINEEIKKFIKSVK